MLVTFLLTLGDKHLCKSEDVPYDIEEKMWFNPSYSPMSFQVETKELMQTGSDWKLNVHLKSPEGVDPVLGTVVEYLVAGGWKVL